MLETLTGKWVIRRTIWPYPEGWGTFNPQKNMVLDTGLSEEEAQKRCDQLNKKKEKKKPSKHC